MLNLFGNAWGRLTKDDIRHVCGMTEVRDYCVTWALDNTFDFERWLPYALRFPSGNIKEWQKDYKKYVAGQEADPSVTLSGQVDLEGLPGKVSVR